MKRRRFKPNPVNLEERLAERAANLLREAQRTPPGVERDRLMRLAEQAETGSKMSEWLKLPGLHPPK
jgi:hypothetical protein